MKKLPIEIMFEIIKNCDFLSKIKFGSINKYYYKNIKITDLLNIPKYCTENLNNKIIRQSKFKNLKKLNANNKITTRNFKIEFNRIRCIL